jgi:hypothetical protein
MSDDIEKAAQYGVEYAEAMFKEFQEQPQWRGPNFRWSNLHESIGRLAAASLHSIERFDDVANEMLRSLCGAAASVRTKELVIEHGLEDD